MPLKKHKPNRGVRAYAVGLVHLQESESPLLEIYSSLNRQQRLTVAGWLKKGRVATLEEGLAKIKARIAQDNEQGRNHPERE